MDILQPTIVIISNAFVDSLGCNRYQNNIFNILTVFVEFRTLLFETSDYQSKSRSFCLLQREDKIKNKHANDQFYWNHFRLFVKKHLSTANQRMTSFCRVDEISCVKNNSSIRIHLTYAYILTSLSMKVGISI